MRYLQWGEGSGQTAADNDINDAGNANESRTEGTTSQQTTNTTGDTYQVQGTITASGNRAITEVGVFDQPAGGNMGIYGDFDAINLAVSDSISFTVKVVLDQAV